MKARMLQRLEQRGYAGSVASIQHLHDLRRDIEANYGSGSFDEEFHQERLTGFAFSPPESLLEARSLIVVAVRQPQMRFAFAWKEELMPIIVPPTYIHWRETDRQVQETLAEVLGPEGYQVVQALLPKKPLAAHSGLAAYGRNNITYVAGMGSFHRLVAFYSDLPCEGENWQESRMVERCKGCQACIRQCPSGAISTERFLLHAERCIAFHNEKPGEVPFPAWLEASWHDCLVGCMQCQRVCPENKEFVGWVEEGAQFSLEETALLVAGTPLEQLPARMVKKLEECGLLDMVDILPRNLRVLLERMG